MRPTVEVFAVGPDSAQLVGRRLPPEGVAVSIGERAARLGGGGAPVAVVGIEGLGPGRTLATTIDGRAGPDVVTPPRPPGALLARVATISDLHVGERAFGFFPRMRSVPASGSLASSHAMVCLRAALAEIVARSPDLLVVKGDVAHHNDPAEYDAAMPELVGCGLPLLVGRGNHDGGNHRACDTGTELARHGLSVADPLGVADVRGTRVVLLDTVVAGRHGGTATRHLAELTDVIREHRGPLLVLLHHQLMTTPIPWYLPVGIPRRDAQAFLDALGAVAPHAFVSSGHTHRHRSRRVGPITVTEVGAPKDHPGTWAEYECYEGGIVQVVRRIQASAALAWTERSGATVLGAWRRWSPGRLGDRCVTHLLDR